MINLISLSLIEKEIVWILCFNHNRNLNYVKNPIIVQIFGRTNTFVQLGSGLASKLWPYNYT